MNRKSVEFRRQLCFYLEFLILEDPLVSPMFNSAGVFHRENLSFIFPYGTYWANIEKIKFTMAQRRLEVTFQLLDVTNIWSCDWSLMPTAKYVYWKILCYMSKWDGGNVLLKAFHYYLFFFFFNFFICLPWFLKGWLTKSMSLLVKTELYPQNYHIWSKLNLDLCMCFLQAPDFFRFRTVIQTHLSNED